MTIHQRAPLDGVLVDVVCTGRFYDFLEKRNGQWGIVRRQPIYEKDRLDPVDPSAVLKLDTDLLASFPKATATWAIYNPRMALPSKLICPVYEARRWKDCMPKARHGWLGRNDRACQSSCYPYRLPSSKFDPRTADCQPVYIFTECFIKSTKILAASGSFRFFRYARTTLHSISSSKGIARISGCW